jgi:hypothetical protein
MGILARALRTSGPSHGSPPYSSLWYPWYQSSSLKDNERIRVYPVSGPSVEAIALRPVGWY